MFSVVLYYAQGYLPKSRVPDVTMLKLLKNESGTANVSSFIRA